MYTNLIVDFCIGLIPVVGDFADAWFKCNTRNNVLLERYLREKGQKNPAPAPPPKEKSTMRRWFGPDANVPGSHATRPAAGSTAEAQMTSSGGGNDASSPQDAITSINADPAKVDGGHGTLAPEESDLEAQEDNVIH